MRKKGAVFSTLFFLVPALLGMTPQAGAASCSRAFHRWSRHTMVASAAYPSGYGPYRLLLRPHPPRLRSSYALVVDQAAGDVVYASHPDDVVPIASITKLMSAMVLLDAHLPMDKPITILRKDVDTIRGSRSRLPVGWILSRWQLLNLALMCSENRAAYALARTYPGGRPAFVSAMNEKAGAIGMDHSRFFGPTGLDDRNVSTARDLAKLVTAASGYETIRRMTTMPNLSVCSVNSRRPRLFGNSNRLIRNHRWRIDLSKTGYISEAGYCLVMEAKIEKRPIIFVFLDSHGKYSRIGDAQRIKRWLES